MSEQTKSQPAFPVHPEVRDNEPHAGMTLRDYFAAKALQAMMTRGDLEGTETDFAKVAFKMADAMLKAREA